MYESLKIDTEMRGRIPILTIQYEEGELFTQNFSQVLASQIVEKFWELVGEEVGKQSNVVIVSIKANTAGSPLVRALFDLYKVIRASSGSLIVAGYPVEYMGSLTSLGLPILPGFYLKDTFEDALEFAKNPQAS